ncbi:hypothetical protein QFC22_001378 [Naganishia vaughanmartiniae]|uniref:Uncharacterized protein n=1 Tax=Naganishia vaughanmartiniae TaxID=1424756 RepID=A0ACC2XHW5_9TREE|nr:hypothetical protein QFC22_001378 [Naganishia vaughanmartiniae]
MVIRQNAKEFRGLMPRDHPRALTGRVTKNDEIMMGGSSVDRISLIYRENANFVYSEEFTDPLLEMLDPERAERIVDLGCGSGELTAKLGRRLEKAKSLNSDATNIVFAPPHDIQTPLSFPIHTAPEDECIEPHSFNAVFSNATFHWCKSPASVLALCRSLLVQDGTGRLVVEMGGGMNMIGVRSAIWQALKKRGVDPVPLDPWHFPRVQEYKSLLISEGFAVRSIELIPRPTRLPTSLYGWLTTFARSSFLSSFSDKEAEEIMREVEEACAPDCRYEEMDKETGLMTEKWEVMYVRLRFEAVLKQCSDKCAR